MIARSATLAVVGFWVVMMGWLTWHDLWPAWTAQEPPRGAFEGLPSPGVSHSQAGIFDAHGDRIGTAWTVYTRMGPTARRDDCLWIAGFANLPPTRVEGDSTFDAAGQLDDLEVRVTGPGLAIEVKGERFPREFAFELRLNLQPPKTFKIPHAQAGAFGDMFRPFDTLHDLHVGQSWRMQVFNPAAAAVTGLGEPFTPLLVQVTGTETRVQRGVAQACFVVEAAGTRAVVSPDGTVLEQRVELPIGGTVVIRDEPFDAEALQNAKTANFNARSEGAHEP